MQRWTYGASDSSSSSPAWDRCTRSRPSSAPPRRLCHRASRPWPARVGTPLVEPDGRRVRLTPAGHRLAEHAVTILASVEAARLDLARAAEPVGVVRVAGFATAIRLSLLPAVAELAPIHPRVELQILEHEPPEALDLLGRDDIDLALTYDYNL